MGVHGHSLKWRDDEFDSERLSPRPHGFNGGSLNGRRFQFLSLGGGGGRGTGIQHSLAGFRVATRHLDRMYSFLSSLLQYGNDTLYDHIGR